MNPILLSFLFLFVATVATAQNPNNTLRGKVLYQSSGNKPAVGVRIAEPDANAVFSVDNGDYQLKFQNKRNGAALELEIGKDDGKKQKLELVNEKEVKAAKLPANMDEILEIIVCPAGQRDIAAQKYYRILRTTADKELEKKKKEVEGLLTQKEKDYQKISDLFAQLDGMQAALDSAKIREQAFTIASINLDRASQMVKDAVKKIEEENDVEGALKILDLLALDTAYFQASALKKTAENEIKQVIEGYKLKISLLEPQFKYGEIAGCYEKIAYIYVKEGYNEEELANNLGEAATFWDKNGDYQKQLEFNLKASVLFEKVLPPDHPDLMLIYSHLAESYSNVGEHQKALEITLRTLEKWEKSPTVNLLYLAQVYNDLGLEYGALGNYQKELEYDLKALEMRKITLPADHPFMAISLGNLAVTYGRLGDYQKALEYDLNALAIREKALPINHPHLAASYNSLAETHRNLGDYQKALEFDLKAVAIREKILPAIHPDLAISYNSLAATYSQLGEQQKALEFSLKTLAIREKVLSAEHPLLALSYSNLNVIYTRLQEYQKASEFGLKALSIREKILPADHPDLAMSYSIMAGTYGNLGEHQKALEFNLKALAIREKVLPADHPDLVSLYSNIGTAYRNVGQYPKSIEYGQKAIQIGENSNPKHRSLNRFYASIGITYAKSGHYTEARTALEKSVSLKPEERVYRGWAMYYALQKKKKLAVESLQKAVSLGFKDLKWLETEPDLKNIRKEKGYKEIVEQLKKQ